MSSITYQALRELEATGYLKSGTDISAAAGDDSFNSVSTSLLGLSSGEWANVAGFTNAANNGWFQASANSTATKVAQGTTTSLVTEAAGANISLVGYKRGFNQTYSFDFNLEMAARQRSEKTSRQQPLGGGAPEVIFYRSEILLSLRTGVIQEASLGQWREFLASANSGETFTIDRYGTAASPVEAKIAMMESESYEEEREGTLYPGRYRISFMVRLLN